MTKSFLDPADPTRNKTPLQNRRINGVGSARRSTPHKARYLPYRGDSPHIGKRTGITISPVPRDEDGFEPFEEVLKQVDMQHTAWLRGRHILEALNENRERREGEEKNENCSSNKPRSGLIFRSRTPPTPTPIRGSAPLLLEPVNAAQLPQLVLNAVTSKAVEDSTAETAVP
ncbi:hypothetical protein NMY22_g3927 [Coprinellus aureogranulatus]|nr:hypothetical protein NMY22_g3927 [Coprinellus aureogranulatus]